MKNSNGKTIFIESPMIGRTDNNHNSNNNNINEEAKSVIAVLDNILKTEESVTIVHDLNEFNRKTSVDSEMIPSFIEASIVAMVHKSYENLLEEENEENMEELSKINLNTINNYSSEIKDHNDFIILNIRTEDDILNLNKCYDKNYKSSSEILENNDLEIDDNNSFQDLKSKLVIEEMENFNNKRIKEAKNLELLENNKSNLTVGKNSQQIEQEVQTDKNDLQNLEIKNSNNIRITESKENLPELNKEQLLDFNHNENVISIKETNDNNNYTENEEHNQDPLHSKSFKDKLSKLISRPYLQPMKSKPYDEDANNEQNKQNINHQENAIESNEILLDEILNNTEISIENTNNDNGEENSIPKPPKFDPILYNTIGKRKYLKEQAKLEKYQALENEKQIKSSSNHDNNIEQTTDDTSSTLTSQPENPSSTSFKNKLEAILKRGPSYRAVRSHTPPIPTKIINNKTSNVRTNIINNEKIKTKHNHENGNKSNSIEQNKKKFTDALKSLEDNKTHITNKRRFHDSSRPSTIEDALKRLKPVAKITSSSSLN